MNAEAELLLEFTRTRSEQAFRKLVERFGGNVHSICYRRLRDPHLAEDAAQTVFLTLANKASSIDPALVGPWLYRTSMIIARDAARKRDLRKKHEQRGAEVRPSRCESDDSAAIGELVDLHLSQLDKRSRDALVLRYFHDQNVSEVAAALHIAPEAAKKRLARGLDRLRKSMAKSGLVASVAVAEAALRGLKNDTVPPGFVDRVIGKVNAKGLLDRGGRTPGGRLPRNLPLVIGTTATVGLLGTLTVYWVIGPRQLPKPAPPPPVPNGASLSIAQRLGKRFAPFATETSIEDTIKYLSDSTHETIYVDWDLLEKNGVNRRQVLQEKFFDPTLGAALDRLIHDISPKPGQLRYVVEPKRIVITVS